MVGVDATAYIWILCQISMHLSQTFYKRSKRDRLGFYAEIPIFLGQRFSDSVLWKGLSGNVVRAGFLKLRIIRNTHTLFERKGPRTTIS